MAKSRVRYAEAPPHRDAYFGMLVLINLSMLLGIVALALECTDYGWDSEPKGGPNIVLPKYTPSATRSADRPAGNPAAQPPAPLPPAPEMGQAAPPEPLRELPAPLVPPVVALNPEVAPPPSKPVPLSQPEAPAPTVDEGPRPGFNPYLRFPPGR